jgi:hypothetical protein
MAQVPHMELSHRSATSVPHHLAHLTRIGEYSLAYSPRILRILAYSRVFAAYSAYPRILAYSSRILAYSRVCFAYSSAYSSAYSRVFLRILAYSCVSAAYLRTNLVI